ncbi:MAG TPA: hypothetical protein VF762_24800 [Blastocatellia bacterium]|jgi:hypothetical protein
MNCQLFETIINDLERGALTDARTRDDAMAHSGACGRCAARLRDERMLTAGLRRMAATAEAKGAPPRVESALRAAFREQHSRGRMPLAVQPRRRRWAGWEIATAATILILLSLAAIRVGRSPQAPVENASNVKPEQTPPAQVSSIQTPLKSTPPAITPSSVHGRQALALLKPRAPRRNARPGAGLAESKSEASAPEATEIATDFIPIVHGDSLNSMESGQIVRVELPRSALISFGLPMNMERADERIKADVVLGNDGLARAIRFVR